MVTLTVPNSTEVRYLHMKNWLVGPLECYDPLKSTDMSIRCPFDAIQGQRGLYGDNNVSHKQLSGWIRYDPASEYCTPNPSPEYPKRIRINYPSNISYDILYGFGVPGNTSYYFYGAGNSNMSQSTIIASEDGGFEVYTIVSYSSRPSEIFGAWKWKMKFGYLNPDKISATVPTEEWYLSGWWKTSFNTFNQLSSLQIREIVDGYYKTFPSNVQHRSSFPETMICRSVTINRMIIKQIKDYVSSLRFQVEGNKFVPESVHYGILAQEASQKVNATRINLIAFLRDLRHPSEMIPKLKNVGLLKNAANNYLTVKYGILPTLSDIDNILQAFNRLRPYLDKNGFSTYNANRQQVYSSSVDRMTIIREQRIKLAVKDNDEGLIRLANSLEKIGAFPSLENIWDLIPYSFVIDWLLDVGSFLERVDTRLRIERLVIPYVTMSDKITMVNIVLPTLDLPISGSLTSVSYHRWVTDHCPVPPLIPQSSPTLLDHWLEASALLTQRAKRVH